MSIKFSRTQPPRSADRRFNFARLAVVVVFLVAVLAFFMAMGWHRQLSLESLVHHRAMIEAFVSAHRTAAFLAFIAIYAAAVAISFPGASALTVCGGMIFGGLAGGLAAGAAATLGATLVFLIAKFALGGEACGDLARRGGALAEKLAAGFRQDAFWYLVFLRLVPLFPFWLVNLVPAPCGVGLAPFVAATALGIIPATFAFAFFGAGLDSAVAAQESAYQACIAAHQEGCRLNFDIKAAATPELIGGLVALGLIALIPPAIKRYKAGRDAVARSGGVDDGVP
jgi:uncharacterized membrane protein YdjX (TVP38/TMEM64 family)